MRGHAVVCAPRLVHLVSIAIAAALAGAACEPTQADEKRGVRTDCIQCHREDYGGAPPTSIRSPPPAACATAKPPGIGPRWSTRGR